MGRTPVIDIETDLESTLHAYFATVEYLPTEVRDRAVLMSQDLGKLIADQLHAKGVDVNWSDGSYRPGGTVPLGFQRP
jgi:hypothetical protein